MNRLSRVAVLVTVALGMLIPVSPGGGSIGGLAASQVSDTVVVVLITLILVAVAVSSRIRKRTSS